MKFKYPQSKYLHPKILSIFSALIFAFVLGWTGRSFFHRQSLGTMNVALREKSKDYKFIDPLLLCDTATPPRLKEYQDLKNNIQAILKNRKEQGVLKRASMYYRDLTSGNWLGINENEHYSPASLLKVPTMIALLKFAEQNPGFLDKKIFYDGSFDDNRAESIKPLKVIVTGESYTQEDLILRMVGYSDNNATRVLTQSADLNFLSQVYTDLGLGMPTLQGPIDFMSVKNYSYFFRVLYNASYLNREMSEKALAFLSLPDFPKGIQGGLPSDIMAAQKFGERTVFYKNNPNPITKELHDCGIVYYPEHPYILCVMTEGDNFDDLAGVIRDISKATFEDVKKR